MKILLIAGASGHGKVIADIAWKTKQYEALYFLDDDESIKELMGVPVVGKITADINKIQSYLLLQNLGQYTKEDIHVVIAIGNSKIREEKQLLFEQAGYHLATLVHPSAIIGTQVKLGEGTVVMAQAVINPDSVIGKGCIVNTASSVDHDNEIGDYSHISVGSHLAGNVHVGRHTWIGAGAVVKNNITICKNCMVGAGAVVIKDVEEIGTYIGVPARRMKE